MLTSPLRIHFYVLFLNDPMHDFTCIKYLDFLKSKINLSYPTPTSEEKVVHTIDGTSKSILFKLFIIISPKFDILVILPKCVAMKVFFLKNLII